MAFKTHINNAIQNQPGQVTTLLTAVLSEGVYDLTRLDFKVSGTAGLAVNVAKGEAFVENDSYVYGSQDQKFFSVANNGTESVPIPSNSSGNPRIDLVCIKVDTGAAPGTQGQNAASYAVITGTAAASPVAPAILDNHLVLAEVTVANGASAISDNDITDRRIQATIEDKGAGWKYAGGYNPTATTPTTTVFVGQDLSWLFERGDRIRHKQGGGYKYFKVADVTYTTNTILTLDGQNLYTQSSATITDFYYSKVLAPVSFPRQLDGVWWEELGRATVTSAGSTITVDNLPARKYLKLYVTTIPTGGTIRTQLRFNNDSGSNYASKIDNPAGNEDSPGTSQTSIFLDVDTSELTKFAEVAIINAQNSPKLGISHSTDEGGSDAGTAPNRRESFVKWVNTSQQITRIDVVNLLGTGNYAIGSEIVVLGHD